MRIMVTNDDGIDSTGLQVLARAMRPHGDVVVIAPNTEYSGAGAALGALDRLKPEVYRTRVEGIDEAWAVTGSPALCVMFSRLGAFGKPFDLIVSGINPGANVGRSVYHSGTVGAALTARNGGVSGVAVSQAVAGFGVEGQGWDDMLIGQQWDSAASVASAVVAQLLTDLPTDPVVININVPNLPVAEFKGWRSTVIGGPPPRVMSGAVLEPKVGHDDAFHVRMSWGDTVTLPIETDGGAVENDEVSITFLNRIEAHSPACSSAVGAALDRFVALR